MSIPAVQKKRIFSHIVGQKVKGNEKFPLILMLEPLFQCNLRCKGCGKIQYPPEILNKRLSVEECVQAAEECGAPVVSIPGGEPLLHPEITTIVSELMQRKRFVYLCTNAQILAEKLDEFPAPSPYLNFSVHLDGLEEVHDRMVDKEGAFKKAIDAVKLALSRGYRVTTNTTLFKGDSPEQAAEFFDLLTELGVEAMTVTAAFSYEKAEGQDAFMNKAESHALFKEIFALGNGRKWKFNHSSLYLDVLDGTRTGECRPWGAPARNVFGWQKPCYLLNDGYVDSYQELMETTEWDKCGPGKDPRCTNCLVHSGFEPEAASEACVKPWKELNSNLRRKKVR